MVRCGYKSLCWPALLVDVRRNVGSIAGKVITMLSAMDVARYFLAQCDREEGELISNLKLQKLLYYAQGVHLAVHNEPLFPEAIEAWDHGPVVPSVYHVYKRHRDAAIPRPTDVDFGIYSEQARDTLDEVYNVFGQFSAWKLRRMTHDEPPWRDTPRGAVIGHDPLKNYFQTLLK